MEATQHLRGTETANLNRACSLAALAIPPGSRVLDVGCGDGAAALLLADRGCQVVGVEVAADAARFARHHCERVIVGDIEDADTQRLLAGERFDAIVLLDVLGYLRHPLSVVIMASQLLKPGGRLLASFGNVAHGAVRLSLMRGDFRYTDTGLLDRARVRFFDRWSAEALLLEADLRIDDRLRVTRELEDTEIPIDTTSLPADFVDRLRCDRDATTYEFVFVASRAVSQARAAGPSLGEQLQARVHELQTRCRTLEEHGAAARSDLDAQRAANRELEERIVSATERAGSLETELTVRMEELHLRHQEMRQLQSDVAVREGFIAQLRTQATVDRTTLNAVRSELLQARAELAKHVAESHRDRTRLAAEVAEGQLERASLAAQVADTRRELGAGAELLTKASSERDLSRQQGAEAQAQLETTNRELLAVRAYASSAGFQLVERIGVRLRRHTRLYRTLQSAVRKMAS